MLVLRPQLQRVFLCQMLRGFPLAWQVTPAHVFIDHQLLFCCCHLSENEKFIIGETLLKTTN